MACNYVGGSLAAGSLLPLPILLGRRKLGAASCLGQSLYNARLVDDIGSVHVIAAGSWRVFV